MVQGVKILIAYDGSAGAEAALEDLKRAGLPEKGSAWVVSVADVFLPSGLTQKSIPKSMVPAVRKGWEHALQAVERSRMLAHRASKKIKADFPGWKVRPEAFADSPAWGILKKAAEWKADLIVLGAHGLSAAERLILGSISQRVVSEARCSVRVVHRKPEDLNSPPRLVVGVDGSPGSDKAVLEVVSRRWHKGTAVHLVTVIDPRMRTSILASPSATRRWVRESDAKAHHWTSRFVEKAAEKLRSHGFAVTFINNEGDPKKILLEEAGNWGADCIFLGARGLSGIRHYLIGSVSASLAARAHCTVEIVR